MRKVNPDPYRQAGGVGRRAQDNFDHSFDLDALLHPAQAFAHPLDVVRDADLTLNEKRAVLTSWASDACAVETTPELRQMPGCRPIRFDDIMDALRVLDREAGAHLKAPPHYRRVLADRVAGVFGRSSRGRPTDRRRPAG
jgi:hypothetical protein